MRNVKLYAKITALAGSVLLMFTGCGESHKVVDSSDTTSVTNTTDEVEETGFVDDTDFVFTFENTTTRETTSISDGENTSKSYIDITIGTNVTTSGVSIAGTTARTTSATTSTTKVASSRDYVAETTAKTTTTPKVTTTTVKTTTTPNVTTTTTAATTQQQGYALNDIANDVNAFYRYRGRFVDEMASIPGSLPYVITMSYGQTACGTESYFMFAALNEGYISDGVLKQVFSEFTEQDLENSKEFFYLFKDVQNIIGNKIDYTKYTLDRNVGEYLNKIQSSYFDGTFDQFMTDQIINGNIPQEYLSNTAIMTLICSYDTYGKYVQRFDVDNNCMNRFINHIYNAAYGFSYKVNY